MTDQNKQADSAADQPQPLIAHLIELRGKLLKSVVCVIAIFLSLYYFSNDLYTFVSEPLRKFLPEGSTMIATDVASPFFTPFKLTLMTSVFIGMPYLLYQIWSFIAPALYEKEKRLAVPLLLSSIVLFYLGMAFAYFVVFPLVFGFFTSAGPEDVAIMTDISSYLDFVLKLFFAFGLAFEIPIATILLVAAGITTTQNLREKRPYVVVACFLVGMLLTPPDVISQLLLAIPMWLLFEMGIIFSSFMKKSSATPEES